MYDALLVATAIGSGVVGGVFFAFSAFVMQGLDRLGEDEAVAAMRSVNLTAVRPPLMVLLFGTGVMAVVAGVWSLSRGDGPLVPAGAVVLVLGTLVTTAVANVPLNDRLAAATVPWSTYRRAWVRWNHVRTVSGALSCGLLCAGLLQR